MTQPNAASPGPTGTAGEPSAINSAELAAAWMRFRSAQKDGKPPMECVGAALEAFVLVRAVAAGAAPADGPTRERLATEAADAWFDTPAVIQSRERLRGLFLAFANELGGASPASPAVREALFRLYHAATAYRVGRFSGTAEVVEFGEAMKAAAAALTAEGERP